MATKKKAQIQFPEATHAGTEEVVPRSQSAAPSAAEATPSSRGPSDPAECHTRDRPMGRLPDRRFFLGEAHAEAELRGVKDSFARELETWPKEYRPALVEMLESLARELERAPAGGWITQAHHSSTGAAPWS
jgi:hypothetical protein